MAGRRGRASGGHGAARGLHDRTCRSAARLRRDRRAAHRRIEPVRCTRHAIRRYRGPGQPAGRRGLGGADRVVAAGGLFAGIQAHARDHAGACHRRGHSGRRARPGPAECRGLPQPLWPAHPSGVQRGGGGAGRRLRPRCRVPRGGGISARARRGAEPRRQHCRQGSGARPAGGDDPAQFLVAIHLRAGRWVGVLARIAACPARGPSCLRRRADRQQRPRAWPYRSGRFPHAAARVAAICDLGALRRQYRRHRRPVVGGIAQ